MKKENIDSIIESIFERDFAQAKLRTYYKVKSSPDRLSHRVGQVVASLIDPEGFYQRSDLAEKYLTSFEEH